ncbi:GntR family transcriptional regulator [Mycolicibacterium vanbaalenii]|nr:GntR family transcriptional regulator [Mycolicibacterium vanbaalenii]
MGANHNGVGVDFPAPAEPPNAVGDDLRRLAGQRAQGYQSLGSRVYEILREAILDGTLKPGQKLRQEVLAESIGVSRVPVRSALIQLEADGLVELRDRRGAVVRALTGAQVREIYSIRAVLETHALRLSMASMTGERIARLRRLAQVVDSQQEGGGFLDARSQFYAELYGAEDQPMLWGLIEQLRLKVGRYVLGWRLVGGTSHSHEELLDAVTRGDVEGAVEGICGHLEQVRDGVLAKLEVEVG